MSTTPLSASHWNVIIIGGGPAGSTAATTLAKAGRKVLVLEKEKFPRFHVGESLLPYNREVFDELGVWPKIQAAGFTVKRGAQFIMGCGTHKVRMNFSRGSFTEFPESIQVERAKFDDLLLKHSQEHGATVKDETLVLDHQVSDNHVAVRYRSPDGSEHAATADFLMDASGLSNFTGNRENVREYYQGHKKLAIFGHFENVDMPKGEEQGDILIIRRENSWFWMIPLEENKTSVGLVLDAGDFKPLKQKPEEVFNNAVQTTHEVQKRFTQAKSQTAMHVVTDFSYRNDKLISPRVVRIGDASGFIDPIFSSGVLLAMTSGLQGAKAVHMAIESGQSVNTDLRQYERDNRSRIAQYWEFIENFYQHNFAQIFFQPSDQLKMTCAINAVLAGRTNLSFSAWWRLRVFFLFSWLNKRVPIVPRIEIK